MTATIRSLNLLLTNPKIHAKKRKNLVEIKVNTHHEGLAKWQKPTLHKAVVATLPSFSCGYWSCS